MMWIECDDDTDGLIDTCSFKNIGAIIKIKIGTVKLIIAVVATCALPRPFIHRNMAIVKKVPRTKCTIGLLGFAQTHTSPARQAVISITTATQHKFNFILFVKIPVIRIIISPPYSPEFNPIEKKWAQSKKNQTHSST